MFICLLYRTKSGTPDEQHEMMITKREIW